jgi:L-serine/L-threonine ammonia-lyase
MSSDNIYIKTPLYHSTNLTKLINHDVYLKLENTQPSGSFKLRGIGYHCQKVSKKYIK